MTPFIVYEVETKRLMQAPNTDRAWAMDEAEAIVRAEQCNGVVLPASIAGAVLVGLREGRLRIGKRAGSYHALITATDA